MPNRSVFRWARIGAAVLLFGVLASGGAYQYWHHLEHRFQAIAEGTLYQSAEMPLDEMASKVQEHGIRTVIDLRHANEGTEPERQAMTALGVDYVHLPSGQIPTPHVLDTFLEIMDRPEDQPVLVHCEHGEGRSVLLAAIYRMEYEGWSADQTRRAARVFHFRGAFSPNRTKGLYLLNYVPRHSAQVSQSDEPGRGS